MKKHEAKYLKDYRPPHYLIDNIDLSFELGEEFTTVRSKLTVRKNNNMPDASPLFLNGPDMELLSISIDGEALAEPEFTIESAGLTVYKTSPLFTLDTTVRLQPQNNTSLEGLYKSGDIFCTQCEAEGFRKITYFIDRPDVMPRFTCTITADREKYPVLLSNGNPVDSGESEGNRHWVKWEDPFKKPSYLFALVAGDLVCIEDSFTTSSGREIALRIYVEEMNAGKCDHAMSSLKKAMKWDEEVYGREYDLDIYMIVAVNDFNMGAMENKGLNVFNSKYILASPESATDADFQGIEGVVAHEYFHNWTGNRITLKNWFQLSLKEGLTVFRDQEFSSDMGSRSVKRIADVRKLRAFQFPEDAGPAAHAVRPESYIQMNNFYTHTVYEKGAEVIRMIHTILGKEGFRRGMDLYFERHDGEAVTTEDFVSCMEEAGSTDLSQFTRWYSRAGTPKIIINGKYDPESRTYTLHMKQYCNAGSGEEKQKPFHIPIALGLLDNNGNEIPLKPEEDRKSQGTTIILNLKKEEDDFTFTSVPDKPIPSILRGFSAPVKLKIDYSDAELLFLLANDKDEFNRWDAGQKLYSKILLALISDYGKDKELKLPDSLIEAFRRTLLNSSLDKALISQALTLPGETEIGDMSDIIDVEAIHEVRRFILNRIASELKDDFLRIYNENKETGAYETDQLSIAKRRIKNLALAYLGTLETREAIDIIFGQFKKANNMTDTLAAFSILSDIECSENKEAVDLFYQKWSSDTLVLDKWFAIQAGSRLAGTFDRVLELLNHKDFSLRNPNKVRSLISVFCDQNQFHFHRIDGKGYEFLADHVIILNKSNPQIAARMVASFNRWKKFDPQRRGSMKSQLERIVSSPDLSDNVYEIVSNALN